jgi:putative membrane protein
VNEPEDGWQRLHPLSPIVRGGRATIAVGFILLPVVFGGRSLLNEAPQIAVIGVIVGLGFVSWLVTRWRIDGDDLRIETGVLRRRSLRFPLSQVQAVDIVRPGLARMFGVAELRLRMGGSTGATARLAYLPEREVEPLRARLLALASRDAAAEPVDATAPAPEERVLATVDSRQLVVSVLISDVGLYAEMVILALILGAVFAPGATAGIVGGGFIWIVGSLTVVWRRFNQEYRLTVSEDDVGLHLRGGLVALTAETIRPGRVQAVRLVEPFLWQTLGWCRLEVDVAGSQRAKGEGDAQRGRLRAVLPVGSRAVAEELLDMLVPDRPRHLDPAPPRARWKSPLRYRKLAWARTDTCVAARSGRLRRVTSWVPLEKVQSLRRVQGPIQRRFTLETVHVDTAGKGVHASLRDRDSAEAERALVELADLARAARRAA